MWRQDLYEQFLECRTNRFCSVDEPLNIFALEHDAEVFGKISRMILSLLLSTNELSDQGMVMVDVDNFFGRPDPDGFADKGLLRQCVEVFVELDELVETGFGPKVVEVVEKMLGELDAIEHDTDQILMSLYHGLKDIENSLNPVDVMFLYRLFDLTGKIGDRAQRVGSRLMLMLAK